MASPPAPIGRHWAPPTLTDELLEEIFLRLPTPADLARACTAHPSFRRIITDRSFLRRFRAIHPPPLLGLVDNLGFHPAEPPHPSAPLGRALADAADFSYSFVHTPYGPFWCPRDVRDGRVLLECNIFQGEEISTNLAVCDPVSRRYFLLPRIPENIVLTKDRLFEFVPFLAPIGDDEDETSFKVIGVAQYRSKLVVFVFSSITREWCVAASTSWTSLGIGPPSERTGLSFFDYVRGCFYWATYWANKLFSLDVSSMEFSTIDVPTGYQMGIKGRPHIVMGKEGALDMCSVDCYFNPYASYKVCHYTTQQNNGELSKQWQVKNVIPVPGQHVFFTKGAEGFLFTGVAPKEDIPVPYLVPLPENWDLDYFSLDVKTSELSKVCRARLYPNEAIRAHPYFGFPQSLSHPSL